MHEPVVADIDAHVGIGAIEGVEKDQIPRPQGIPGNFVAPAGDVGGGTFHPQPGGLAVNVGDHAAAIQARLRVFAAETIARVQESKGVEYDFLSLLPGGLVGHGAITGASRATAGGQTTAAGQDQSNAKEED